MEGYVKTQNMYLAIMVALSAGFIAGVIFTSYRSSASLPVQPTAERPGPAPMTREQGEALAALIQATQTTPEDVDAWTQLGHFYFDQGQPEKAIQAYEKSLALDNDRPDVWTDMGVMYRQVGDPSKAIESFDHALGLDSRHEVALFNKGVVLMHDLKDTPGALQAWQKLVQINPNAKTQNGQSVKVIIEQIEKAK